MRSQATQRVIWKVKPQPYQVAKEFDSVKLNCEFQYESTSDTNNKAVTANLDVKKHFVIWYKDGRSQNVLSLNDQLAQLNASNYEINGTYNLVIKNLTKENSGLYTCQLFQSIDLVASVNLTVLGINITFRFYLISCFILFLLPTIIKQKQIRLASNFNMHAKINLG